MSSLTPKLFFIGNGSGNIYTVPGAEGSYSIIKSINVCNTSSSTSTFSINLVKPGALVDAASVIVGNVSLTAANVFAYETSIVMPTGSYINITQPDSSLTFTISGVEYVV